MSRGDQYTRRDRAVVAQFLAAKRLDEQGVNVGLFTRIVRDPRTQAVIARIVSEDVEMKPTIHLTR